MKRQSLFIRSFRLILFWSILFLLFWYTQEVVKQKFIGDSTSIVNGFYACEDKLDVVFIGPSSSFCTIVPEVLKEEYGMDTYILGSSAQTLDISYVYLQEVLKYQEPQIIVLDVARIKIPETVQRYGEPGKRWGYTDLKLSFTKLRGLYHSCQGINEEFWTYVFPVLRYKNRINELTDLDYFYVFQDKSCPTGGYMGSDAVAEDITICNLSVDESEECFNIHPDDVDSLNKIIRMCNEEEIPLLFFKSPVGIENWGKEYYNAVERIAKDNSIIYFDCGMYIEDIGLINSDFRDKAHCNNSGANKVTSWIGNKLRVLLAAECANNT